MIKTKKCQLKTLEIIDILFRKSVFGKVNMLQNVLFLIEGSILYRYLALMKSEHVLQETKLSLALMTILHEKQDFLTIKLIIKNIFIIGKIRILLSVVKYKKINNQKFFKNLKI